MRNKRIKIHGIMLMLLFLNYESALKKKKKTDWSWDYTGYRVSL